MMFKQGESTKYLNVLNSTWNGEGGALCSGVNSTLMMENYFNNERGKV